MKKRLIAGTAAALLAAVLFLQNPAHAVSAEKALVLDGQTCRVLYEKGIHAQVDFWGHDVDHDWPWWYKMVAHYVPQLLGY